jgi:hypothetical protein
MQKLLSLILSLCLISSPVFAGGLEIDWMEYSTDANAQSAYVTNGGGLTNLLTNPSFETWTGGDSVAPDGWTLSSGAVAKESTTIKVGTYSAKLTNSGGAGSQINMIQYAPYDKSYWLNKTLTFGCWVWADFASARIIVLDNNGAYNISSHPGDSTWRFIKTSLLITNTNYSPSFQLNLENGGHAYFDGAVAVEGNAVFNGTTLVRLDSFSGSGSGNITQGTYSLKVEAAQTDSLNKTLTKTFSTNHNLSSVKNLKLDAYALRTGSNFKLGFHDTGGTTTEFTPAIVTSNTWQPNNLDWSGVADADKDVIDTLTITITNADSANTIRLDDCGISQAIDVFGWIS